MLKVSGLQPAQSQTIFGTKKKMKALIKGRRKAGMLGQLPVNSYTELVYQIHDSGCTDYSEVLDTKF